MGGRGVFGLAKVVDLLPGQEDNVLVTSWRQLEFPLLRVEACLPRGRLPCQGLLLGNNKFSDHLGSTRNFCSPPTGRGKGGGLDLALYLMLGIQFSKTIYRS